MRQVAVTGFADDDFLVIDFVNQVPAGYSFPATVAYLPRRFALIDEQREQEYHVKKKKECSFNHN